MTQKFRLPEHNHVTLIGRLTHDPELKYTQKGQPICRFDIAVNRNYKDASGAWQKEVCFIPIITWREVAVRCGERLKKGSPVHITGRLRSRTWEDKNSQIRRTLEVEAQKVQFLQPAEVEDSLPAEIEQEHIADDEVPF